MSSWALDGSVKLFAKVAVSLAAAILVVDLCHADDKQSSPSCRDAPKSHSVSVSAGAASKVAFQGGTTKPHSVRLSWKASVPSSNLPADAIKGYDVYRRQAGTQYEKINLELIQGTSCTDYSVQAGQTYYYQTKAVSARGAVSKPSDEVKASVPPP